ncbi:hypothetical protein TCAL_15016 [Tigriopus californicus]|uniref:Potassium channel domain-containing protein n=1 Tax=Tigriopus californicus TaxID=6832 RepID=A0A553NX69_TIGCA|nr:hypothetical protein TCAL_15016 [Tigriopus californicus]
MDMDQMHHSHALQFQFTSSFKPLIPSVKLFEDDRPGSTIERSESSYTVGSDADWPVSPLSRILTVIYLIIGAPIMYLYLTSTGSLFSRAIYFALFHLSCGRNGRNQFRKSLRPRANRNDKIKRSLSQTPFYNNKSGSSQVSHEKMAMVNPSSSGNSGNGGAGGSSNTRRSTWQTKGGAGGSGNPHGSASVIVANGSINTLSTIAAEDELNRRPNIALPIFGCVGLLVIYVACGAAVMADTQNWRYGEGIYFCFVSLFTVGFGGLRPDDPNLWYCVLYIFFGLALISTCAHIVKQQVFDELRRYRTIKMRHRSVLESFETLSKGRSSDGGPGNGNGSSGGVSRGAGGSTSSALNLT